MKLVAGHDEYGDESGRGSYRNKINNILSESVQSESASPMLNGSIDIDAMEN